MELQEHTLTNPCTHPYIHVSIQNGIRSVNLPGSAALIAQLIPIFSHLLVHTDTHTHTVSFLLSLPLWLSDRVPVLSLCEIALE